MNNNSGEIDQFSFFASYYSIRARVLRKIERLNSLFDKTVGDDGIAGLFSPIYYDIPQIMCDFIARESVETEIFGIRAGSAFLFDVGLRGLPWIATNYRAPEMKPREICEIMAGLLCCNEAGSPFAARGMADFRPLNRKYEWQNEPGEAKRCVIPMGGKFHSWARSTYRDHWKYFDNPPKDVIVELKQKKEDLPEKDRSNYELWKARFMGKDVRIYMVTLKGHFEEAMDTNTGTLKNEAPSIKNSQRKD